MNRLEKDKKYGVVERMNGNKNAKHVADGCCCCCCYFIKEIKRKCINVLALVVLLLLLLCQLL